MPPDWATLNGANKIDMSIALQTSVADMSKPPAQKCIAGTAFCGRNLGCVAPDAFVRGVGNNAGSDTKIYIFKTLGICLR